MNHTDKKPLRQEWQQLINEAESLIGGTVEVHDLGYTLVGPIEKIVLSPDNHMVQIVAEWLCRSRGKGHPMILFQEASHEASCYATTGHFLLPQRNKEDGVFHISISGVRTTLYPPTVKVVTQDELLHPIQ